MSTREKQRRKDPSTELARALTRTFILSFGIWALAFSAGLWAAGATLGSEPRVPRAAIRNPPGTLQILATNLIVLLISASGLVTFGLTSIVTLLVCGLFMGLVFGLAHQNGMTLHAMLWLTLPHSMELVGLWLANAVGLMGYHVGRRLVSERRFADPHDATLLVELLVIALAVTIIAACIEGEFTLKWVVGRYV